jgi:hypothetical protein
MKRFTPVVKGIWVDPEEIMEREGNEMRNLFS